jgi:proton-dependent oligopeptide transporter, POT family
LFEINRYRYTTAEELATLEHVADPIPWSAWLIVVCEFCERFAFIGLAGPFQNYIQFPVPDPKDKQSGALGRGHRMATLVTTCFQFLNYFTLIGGAVIADQLCGQYKIIAVGCAVYVTGY